MMLRNVYDVRHCMSGAMQLACRGSWSARAISSLLAPGPPLDPHCPEPSLHQRHQPPATTGTCTTTTLHVHSSKTFTSLHFYTLYDHSTSFFYNSLSTLFFHKENSSSRISTDFKGKNK